MRLVHRVINQKIKLMAQSIPIVPIPPPPPWAFVGYLSENLCPGQVICQFFQQWFNLSLIFDNYTLKRCVWFSLHHFPIPQYFLHQSKKLLAAIVISSHIEEKQSTYRLKSLKSSIAVLKTISRSFKVFLCTDISFHTTHQLFVLKTLSERKICSLHP